MGLLPAAYSPPTTAHVALGETAQEAFGLRQVVQVLPRKMPHKRIERPGNDERLRWLAKIAARRASWAACSCPTGLVIDVVDAFREEMGPDCRLFVIAGRDAAERYVSWDYGDGEPFSLQLRRFELLVGSRRGQYRPPAELVGRVRPFLMHDRHGGTSSSGVREAIRHGLPWRHMVPSEICDEVGSLYSGPLG
ncbi:MAG: hypothetical protein OXN89_02085 [Bryobacterales bacterium]|nr:hypothetical protein [Bryobacterales bacterium]